MAVGRLTLRTRCLWSLLFGACIFVRLAMGWFGCELAGFKPFGRILCFECFQNCLACFGSRFEIVTLFAAVAACLPGFGFFWDLLYPSS